MQIALHTKAKSGVLRHGEWVSLGRARTRAAWLVGPGSVWLTLFAAIPVLLLFVLSLTARSDLGEIEWRLTWDNYRRLLGFGELGFDPVYLGILARTLFMAVVSTVLCLLLGIPFAFFLASLNAAYRGLGLALVMIPFWTNLLIRTYAWQTLLAPEGPVTLIARSLGLVGEDAGLYPSTFAVLLCLVCDFLPFMVLPLYASVEKIDWSIADAARDLGARRLNLFRHALWPQIVPGARAGFLLVFLPALGQFVIPDLLGGARTVLLGNVVQQQFIQSRDWPFGAAVACVVLLLVALCLSRGAGRSVAPD